LGSIDDSFRLIPARLRDEVDLPLGSDLVLELQGPEEGGDGLHPPVGLHERRLPLRPASATAISYIIYTSDRNSPLGTVSLPLKPPTTAIVASEGRCHAHGQLGNE